eukprot:1526195-Amphidinium_carterae.2
MSPFDLQLQALQVVYPVITPSSPKVQATAFRHHIKLHSARSCKNYRECHPSQAHHEIHDIPVAKGSWLSTSYPAAPER